MVERDFIVYGASRRIEKMADLESLGVQLIPMDLTQEDAIAKAVDQILVREKSIDILGYGSYGALEDLSMNDARHPFEVNIFGLARLIQLVLFPMQKQRSGRIINVLSTGGSFGEPHGAWYHDKICAGRAK